jgi:hypothetical protein
MLKHTLFAGCVAVALLASAQAMAEPQHPFYPHAEYQPGHPVPPSTPYRNWHEHDVPRVDVAGALSIQDRMIEEGIRNGELTRDEVISLRREQDRIRKADWELNKQGLTRDEAQKLEHMLERAKQHIIEERNNRERARPMPAPHHDGHGHSHMPEHHR